MPANKGGKGRQANDAQTAAPSRPTLSKRDVDLLLIYFSRGGRARVVKSRTCPPELCQGLLCILMVKYKAKARHSTAPVGPCF
jgi:hypothetical protein